MMTLKEASLLKATRNLGSLRELLAFCDSNESFLNSCMVSENFWKESLSRIMGNIIVRQRGDIIGGANWFNFVKSLAVGIVFKYRMTQDHNADTWTTQPQSWYLDQNLIDVDDVNHYPIEIPGVIPVPGTRGYFVKLVIDGDWYQEEVAFFLHSDPVGIAFENATKFIGESYYNILSKKVKDSLIKFTTDGNDRIYDEKHSANFPLRDMPNADFLTQLVIQNDQPLMLAYQQYSRPKDRQFVYTETYWNIEPISF